MERSKFVRMVGALLMILALVLPAMPAMPAAAAGDEDQADVHAANVSGPVVPPGATTLTPSFDVQDCIGTANASNVGLSRYFVTVRSTSGLDITNAVGRIITTGYSLPGVASVPSTVVTMSNGDFESQANDGSPAGGCVPAVNDGH